MKNVSLITLCMFSLAVIGLAFILFFYDGYEWQLQSKKRSPNKEWGLYHYQYLSDGIQHAPYGSYLFLHSESSYAQAYKSHVLLAAYCDELRYAWLSDETIDITCKTESFKQVLTAAQKAYGLKIKLQIK